MLGEPADVELTRCRVVYELGASERLEPGLGEHGECGAPVCWVGLPANETPFLEADDHAGDSVIGQSPRRALS